MFLNVQVVGLRALDGRFDSMMNRGLLAIQLQEARAASDVLVEMYREEAPQGEGDGIHFRESFFPQVIENGLGFVVSIETSQPDKREWLKHGTGIFGPRGERIYPKDKAALAFTWRGENWVLASIAGMRPNPWEHRAEALATPLAREMGNQLGHRVVLGLSQA